MKKTYPVISAAVCWSSSLHGAVIEFLPPEPLLTLPDASSDQRIDVDFDGVDDFYIGGLQVLGTSFGTIASNRYLAIPAIPPNSGGEPEALGAGIVLGSTEPLSLAWLSTDTVDGFVASDEAGDQFTVMTLCLDSGCTGTYYTDFIQGPLDALLGFEFESSQGTHYGYFDFTFTPLSTGGFINGWAYESEPDTPITTRFLRIPEPSTSLLSFFATTLCL